MKRLLFLLLAAPVLLAQPFTVGDPFPLTNTRYGATVTRSAQAEPFVETNGKDFFLFWETANNLRVAKVVDGEHRVGRHVLGGQSGAAVAWTGTHFLVVARRTQPGIPLIGQLLDANAEPVGGEFVVLAPVSAGPVATALASNGRTGALLLHADVQGVHAVALTRAGVPTGVETTFVPPGESIRSFAVASNGDGYTAIVATQFAVTAVSFAGDGRERWRSTVYPENQVARPYLPDIASDGRDYLAAWAIENGGAQAVRMLADGTIRPVITLEPQAAGAEIFGAMQVAWSGANWAVAYTRDTTQDVFNRTLRVAYVHPTLPEIVGREELGAGVYPALAAADGRVLATWRPALGAQRVAALLPLSAGTPEPVTFAAGEQALRVVAATSDSMLAVWNESGTALRAGVRSADGEWVEREIAKGRTAVLAASDGRDFVVILREEISQTDSAVFLDASSRVTRGPVALPQRATAIAWNGTDYVIGTERSLFRLSRSGNVSAQVPLEETVAALASNGTATMAVLILPEGCPILCPGFYGTPRFAQLGADLRPIGEPRLVSPATKTVVSEAPLVWDGNRFLVSWASAGHVNVAELPLEGEATVMAQIDASLFSELRMAAFESGVVLTWREQPAPNAWPVIRFATVGHDAAVRRFGDDGRWLRQQPFPTALPNGKLGLLASIPQYAPPHHGSSRVMMRVAAATLPARPEAPRLTGTTRNGRVDLAWSAPPQDVAGYRIEYRIGSDGTWNEIDRWFDANDDQVTLAWQLRPGVAYLFRIRAFNDAGAGEYSETVLVNVSRRRAVR